MKNNKNQIYSNDEIVEFNTKFNSCDFYSCDFYELQDVKFINCDFFNCDFEQLLFTIDNVQFINCNFDVNCNINLLNPLMLKGDNLTKASLEWGTAGGRFF